jgi:hypothetical protein
VPDSSPDDLDLGATVRGFGTGEKVFHRYVLLRILGRGGMGVVWLARDSELDRNVALKFLPDRLLHERSLLESLKSETRRSLELTHRHIVRIYDFIQDAQSSCISMEYVDGDTLSNLRTKKENQVFEPAELYPYVSDMCEALEYAHDKARIVHRDLKPANLMVNSRNEIKIADFGIARSLSDSVSMMTMSRHTSGTLLYMSPQQLDGERTSPLDDIYSIGAVLYELLTSKPPFYRGQVDHQIRSKMPASIGERRAELGITAAAVPLAWQETIAACLAKKPSDRPQSAREIAQRLSATVRPGILPPPIAPIPNDQIEKDDGPAADQGAFRAPSQKQLIYFGAAAVILLLAVIGYFVASTKKPDRVVMPAKTEVDRPTPVRTPELPAFGRIVVNTIPTNASVYLDGTDRGKSPVILEEITPGTHRLSVEAAGFETTALIADVRAGGTVDFGMMHLRPRAAPAPSSTPAATSPPPTPEPTATVTATATPTATPRDLQNEIRHFVLKHLQNSVNADINGLATDYAERVDYYDNGFVNHSFIVKDRQTYVAAWPYLKLTPFGDVRFRETGTAGQLAVSFDYHFEARNNKGTRSMGDAANFWIVETSFGDLKIISEKQTVTSRRRSK